MGRAVEKRRPATYADVMTASPEVVAELIDGTLYTSPRPTSLHARASSRLGALLDDPFDRRAGGGPGGWISLDEPELHLAGNALVPDLGGWRRERMPQLPDVPAFTLAPDWVCEVLSPATAVLDRKRKMPRYAEAGVRHAWLIDPQVRSLEVYRLDGELWQLLVTFDEEDERVRAEPFDAVELDLRALWAR
jgi:Uma2 family endonuclease